MAQTRVSPEDSLVSALEGSGCAGKKSGLNNIYPADDVTGLWQFTVRLPEGPDPF